MFIKYLGIFLSSAALHPLRVAREYWTSGQFEKRKHCSAASDLKKWRVCFQKIGRFLVMIAAEGNLTLIKIMNQAYIAGA